MAVLYGESEVPRSFWETLLLGFYRFAVHFRETFVSNVVAIVPSRRRFVGNSARDRFPRNGALSSVASSRGHRIADMRFDFIFRDERGGRADCAISRGEGRFAPKLAHNGQVLIANNISFISHDSISIDNACRYSQPHVSLWDRRTAASINLNSQCNICDILQTKAVSFNIIKIVKFCEILSYFPSYFLKLPSSV